MDLENDLLELDEELLKTDEKFASLLESLIPDYKNKIKYDLSYSHKEDKYKLALESLNKNKQPSEYFNDSSLNDLAAFCMKYNIDFPFE